MLVDSFGLPNVPGEERWDWDTPAIIKMADGNTTKAYFLGLNAFKIAMSTSEGGTLFDAKDELMWEVDDQ